jgi:hypothetical protein
MVDKKIADEVYIKRLKKRLTTEPGIDGEAILNETIRINTILNKIPYKLKLLRMHSPRLAKWVRIVLKRFVGVEKSRKRAPGIIGRYQIAVEKGKAKKIGFFKGRTLNNFRIQFESLLRHMK